MLLRLMLFILLTRQIMLLEEFDPHPTNHTLAQNRVMWLAEDAGELMRRSTNWRLGTVRPRSRWNWLPFGRRHVSIAWLGLYNPLWVNSEGTIVRHYETVSGKSYFMEAEIHLRNTEGLLRIEDALQRFNSDNISV